MARKSPQTKDDVVWRALAAPHRRSILRFVRDRECTAGEIAAGFDISRPAVSQHLSALKDAGLLAERRDGTKRLYRVNLGRLGVLSSWLGGMGAVGQVERPRRVTAVPRPVVREHSIELEAHPAAVWRLLADPQQRARWKAAPEPEVLDVEPGKRLRWRWRWMPASTPAEVDVELVAVGRASLVTVIHRGAEPDRWPAYLERLQVVARGWDPGSEDEMLFS